MTVHQHSGEEERADRLGTLGERLKAVRKARGFKLGYAARQVGVSRTSFGMWESNNVRNPDINKLIAFTRLADVSLDWLTARRGEDPDLTPPGKPRRATERTGEPISHGPRLAPAADAIPEVAAPLSAHAERIDLTPRAFWSIPQEVLELGFNATPGRMVMKRVATREGSEFGIARGDYVLIDTARDRIDEPGVYLLADPEGRSALRALVKWESEMLRIVVLADDVNRENKTLDERATVVLGRIMGIFKPT